MNECVITTAFLVTSRKRKTMDKRSILTSVLHCVVSLNFLKVDCDGKNQDRYIGCYYGAMNDRSRLQKIPLQNNTALTIELCVGQCLLRNSTYAGLENSKACLCGNNFSVIFPDTHCNSLCPGNQSEYCGGSNEQRDLYSLYAVCEIGYYGYKCDQVCHCRRQAPCERVTGRCPNGCEAKWFGPTCNNAPLSEKYIGCFRDNKTRAISGEHYCRLNETVEFCSSRCIAKNSTFLGLQAGCHCFCGESYARYGPIRESDCSSPCNGNGSQKCGGGWANSVYSVCPAGNYGPKCGNQCNCYNNSRCVYLTGECNNSTCRVGWTGKSCNVRDCNIKNGDCPQNETCVNVNLKFAKITRCRCLPGFERNVFLNICQDVDECVRGFCDASTTDCTNTIGSYNCACKPGYQQNTKGTCNDVDECTTKIHNCSNATEECNNTIGSFICVCKKGLQRNNNSCEDVDECDLKIHNCSVATEECNNTIGRFVCNCKKGFERKNKKDNCEAFGADGAEAFTGNGAVVGSVFGLTLIVVIALLGLFLYRRRQPEKLENNCNQMKELPISSQEIIFQDRSFGLYGDDPNAYEEIGPTTGNALKTLHSKLSDLDSMKEEFESVNLQLKEFCALGTMAEVKKKNRFVNIIPYESNRVVLSMKGDNATSQYINASFVQGYNRTTKFIATQGPRAETLEDFWRMIVENHVHLVVMITNLVESQKNKCEKYWPELGKPVVYGDITVTLCSEDSWPDYTVRCIRCSEKSETVELKQLHYLSWPDHGVPSDIKGFLTFRRMARQRMKPDLYTVVHCSAGAGRTGAFIAIDYLLEQEKVEHDVRILECLKTLRCQRSQMIQNLAQYVFVHDALLLAFEIGDTVIPTTQFLSKYKQLQTKDVVSGKSFLEKQFQFLEQGNVDHDEAAKHRVRSKILAESMVIDMHPVFVQSWKLKDAYITAQSVDPITNIWELLREKNCSVMILLEPTPGSEDSFLPTRNNPMTLSDCTLLCESMTKEYYGSRYAVVELQEVEDTTYANFDASDIYQNTESITSKTQVTVFHLTEFTGKSSRDANRLMHLYNDVSNLASEKNNVPVMVVSSDSSLSGFCLAAFNAFEMMKKEEMIDIYQIVLNIRKSKTELFSSMSFYIDLHKVVERYIVMSAV